MLQNNDKAEWNRLIGCGIGSESKQFRMIAAGTKTKKLLHGEVEAGASNLGSRYTQPKFVGQAS